MRQASAEIEATPEMIASGYAALCAEIPDLSVDVSPEAATEIVVAVWSAMMSERNDEERDR